jgi:hypothetical protein
MEKGQEEKRSTSPCYKKKEGAGVLADMRDHLEQFKSTSAEMHWICLKNTARRAGDYVRQKKQSISVWIFCPNLSLLLRLFRTVVKALNQ